MFGQKDDEQNQPFQDNSGAQPPVQDAPNPPSSFIGPNEPAASAPAADSGAPALPTQDSSPVLADPNPADFTAPSTPADGFSPASDAPTPSGGSTTNDDLLSMKQAALQQLNPLVSHLDQGPEDKFRTVMMMIQATDDHTKLGEAFEAAKQITDDKSRAQALLDVINEINYFTQQHSN